MQAASAKANPAASASVTANSSIDLPRGAGSSSRQLPTSDRYLAGLVRVHRDDASTDSSGDEVAAPVVAHAAVGSASSANSFAASGSLPVAIVSEDAQQQQRQNGGCTGGCFGPRRAGANTTSSRRCLGTVSSSRTSCGVTPIACLSGIACGSGSSPTSSGCGPRPPWQRGNSWVCAVLPVDSASEGEEVDGEGNSIDGGRQANVSVASTSTPPVDRLSSAHAPASNGGSETRSTSKSSNPSKFSGPSNQANHSGGYRL